MISWLNELRKNKIIRKEIALDLKKLDSSVKILDDGAGIRGSWDYEPHQNIISCDLQSGIDCQNLPYKNNLFDVVIFSGIIQYINRPDKALKEIRRVLISGGNLIITVLSINSLIKKFTGWKIEKYAFSLENFIEIIESYGFKVTKKKMLDFKFIPEAYKMVIYLKCIKIENGKKS
jgi:ubiquinone/menaquinone biosynthesis C-methylase UbiE